MAEVMQRKMKVAVKTLFVLSGKGPEKSLQLGKVIEMKGLCLRAYGSQARTAGPPNMLGYYCGRNSENAASRSPAAPPCVVAAFNAKRQP